MGGLRFSRQRTHTHLSDKARTVRLAPVTRNLVLRNGLGILCRGDATDRVSVSNPRASQDMWLLMRAPATTLKSLRKLVLR